MKDKENQENVFYVDLIQLANNQYYKGQMLFDKDNP